MENKREKTKMPVYSITLFLLVFLITVWLFGYNIYLQKSIKVIDNDINIYKTNVSELKKDEKLQVYTIIEDNKNILDEMTKRSKITTYINAIEKIWIKMWIVFGDFNLSNGEISIEGTAKTKSLIMTNNEDASESLAYTKVKDFIKNYREDEKALFNLGFINSFNWSDTIRFSMVFTIK